MPDESCHPETAAALPAPYFESPDRRFRLYQGDCLALMPLMPAETFDLIFADPPYFLSNGGITCHAGKMVPVHKGKWDESKGAEADHEFTLAWLRQCRRLLKPNGSIWVSGNMHSTLYQNSLSSPELRVPRIPPYFPGNCHRQT